MSLRSLSAFALVAMALLLGASPAAQAFPDMIRHGYGNCVSCHVSPSGGGILTDYGRELSREVIATWSTEKEPQFLHGLVELPSWLRMGGDIRNVQTYVNNKHVRDGRWIPMQSDLEIAAGSSWLKLVGTLGAEEVRDQDGNKKWEFLSRRHYVLGQVGEKTYLRAGKFMHSYGINLPEHVAVIKRDLGWDEGTETYNAEASWLGEALNMTVTGIFGRPDDKKKNQRVEKGATATVSYLVASRYKLGFSHYQGNREQRQRVINGLWGILAFTEKFYAMTEWDHERSHVEGSRATYGYVAYNRLGYEIVQGFQLNLVNELKRDDLSDKKLGLLAYGPGFQFIPRPHFEIAGLFQKKQSPKVSQDWTDSAWLMLHYYL